MSISVWREPWASSVFTLRPIAAFLARRSSPWLLSLRWRPYYKFVTRIQIRSAILNNKLGGRDGIASETLDRQVKVAKKELHPSHPRRTIPNFHSAQGRT